MCAVFSHHHSLPLFPPPSLSLPPPPPHTHTHTYIVSSFSPYPSLILISLSVTLWLYIPSHIPVALQPCVLCSPVTILFLPPPHSPSPPPQHTLCPLSLPIPLSFSPPPSLSLSLWLSLHSPYLSDRGLDEKRYCSYSITLANKTIVRSVAIPSHLPIALQPCVPLSLPIPLSFSSLPAPLSLSGYPFPSPYRAPTLCSSFSPYPSLILISPSLSLCGYPFPSPYHAPALCSSFSPYPSLILISPSPCLCGYPSHLPIAQLRCVPCDRSSGPTCCTCAGAYAGLSIDCTVTESCASTAPSRPPTLWLVSGLVRPVVIR